MNWQPIDTAPKNGTEVLVYRSDAGVFIAKFGDCDIFGMTEAEAEKIPEDWFWQDDWWSFDHDGPMRLEGDLVPSHWMPLPDPPEENT